MGVAGANANGVFSYTNLKDPPNPDWDDDGLTDGAEFLTHHTLLKVGDTDEDGFLDGYEVLTGGEGAVSPTAPWNR